ncbi:hypothetical protein [Bradyrhizobium sp. SZCCHNS2005]|uniref:hypothetical protein n=1 Tax=Bradyrhizobium sp. SZCCHNS2005 TaxID=3057303 RepID=UPI0028EFC780|nr:hypothetical protein [Bradyrhizobium sp. SZCCHNS2005]
MVAELKRRGCQEHHPFERTVQRARNRAGVYPRVVGHEERGETGGRIFEMMGFVEDQKR